MTFAVFHDFPGLENGLHKFQDFPGPVVTLLLPGLLAYHHHKLTTRYYYYYDNHHHCCNL